MATIFCSMKLSALIGKSRLINLQKPVAADPLNQWNAHLFTIQRKKCIIVTNKATLYSFVRFNIIKKELADLTEFFFRSFLAQLKADHLDQENNLGWWPGTFTDCKLYPTDNDRKVIGSINDFIFQLKVAVDHDINGLGNPTDTTAGTLLNNTLMSLIHYKNPLQQIKTTYKQ